MAAARRGGGRLRRRRRGVPLRACAVVAAESGVDAEPRARPRSPSSSSGRARCRQDHRAHRRLGVFDRPSGGVGRVLRDVELDPSAVDELRSGSPARRQRSGRRPRPARPPNGRRPTSCRFGGRTVVARQGREPAAAARADPPAGWDARRRPRARDRGRAARRRGRRHAQHRDRQEEGARARVLPAPGRRGRDARHVSVRVDGTATPTCATERAGDSATTCCARACCGAAARAREARRAAPRSSAGLPRPTARTT